MTPKLYGMTPKLCGMTPQSSGMTPKPFGVTPKRFGVTAKLSGVAPKPSGVMPKLCGITPKLHGMASQMRVILVITWAGWLKKEKGNEDGFLGALGCDRFGRMETPDSRFAQEAQVESDRLLRLLASRVRLSKKSVRRLAEELGFGSSMISKILNGDVRTQVAYLLMLAGAIGMEPREFFALAYPDTPEEEPGVTREQLDRIVEESVRQAFRRLGRGPEEVKR